MNNLVQRVTVSLFVVVLLMLSVSMNAEAVTLTIRVEGHGTTSPSEGSHSVGWLGDRSIYPYPAPGWEFSHWEGDVGGSTIPKTIIMWKDFDVTAVFTKIIPADAVLVSPDGKGYKRYIDQANDKIFVSLNGSPYEMGYQHGYLLAERVMEQTSNDFMKGVVRAMINNDTIDTILDDDQLWDLVLGAVMAYADVNSIYATAEMRQEMTGIKDGTNARMAELGTPTNLSWDRVCLINTAFDVILGVAYPIIVNDYMTDDQRTAFWASDPLEGMHMCDGFVATNSATQTNSTLMARSFQLTPLVSNNTVVMQYYPNEGNDFVGISMPGWVGTTTAMNEHGLAIGVDMQPALETSPVTVGMGCLLTCRYVMQFEDTTAQALTRIKHSYARGVPWIYLVGDKTSGAVAEAAATTNVGWDPSQAQFFFGRYTDYVFTPMAGADPLVQQGETKNDLVVTANHFIDPAIQIASGSFAIQDSLDRYGLVTTEAVAAIDSAGVSVSEAMDIVTHKERGKAADYHIRGINVLFDMETMTVYARWDHVGDPTVVYNYPQN